MAGTPLWFGPFSIRGQTIDIDNERYEDLVTGVSKPILGSDGFVQVPDTPGLGVELNEEAVKRMLRDPEKQYFPPTPQWDQERSADHLWS